MSGKQKQLKIFKLSGWVQVEVTAYIEATSLAAAQKFFNAAEKKYGAGGSHWNHLEGNWVSEITYDEAMKEVPEEIVGCNDKGPFTNRAIATRATQEVNL